MCLIIYKPPEARIPEELVSAAAVHNPDGWGLMGFAFDGRFLVERRPHVHLPELIDALWLHRDAELALHLRRRTRGGSGIDNVHPFAIGNDIFFMHNGTLPLAPRVAGRSDSWHLAADVLKPLSQRHPGLLSDLAFLQLMEIGLRPENKAALLDRTHRRTVLLNRAHGVELEGLWLSSTRWIDGERFPLARAPQGQERAVAASGMRFL